MRWLRLLANAWRERIELSVLGACGVGFDSRGEDETMSVQGVNMIKHHVDDWTAAIAFYRDGRLKLVYEQPGTWASFEAPDGGRIGLVGEHEGARRGPHVLLRVDALGATVEALRAGGAEIVEAALETAYGQVAVVRDPAGNMIELVQPA